MLENLYTGQINLPKVDTTLPSWEILRRLWSPCSVMFTNDNFYWHITEVLEDEVVFHMTRSVVTMQRFTETNKYGLLGVSLLNLEDKSVILTEGVSDFFSAKLLCPDRNVLGITNVGGSVNARSILVNLFDSFLFCADSDDTGRSNVIKWKEFLRPYGKKVSIFMVPPGCKDVSESLIKNLKMQ